MRRLLLAVLVLAALVGAPAAAATTVIHAGHLIADPAQPAEANQSVVIENGKVTAIKDGFVPGDEVIDLSTAWVMPGLIDMHTHVTATMDVHSANPTADLMASYIDRPAARVLASVGRAQKVLGNGFTTVRNLGDPASVTYDLANAINADVVAGPRIIASEPQFQVDGGDYDPFLAGARHELEPLFKDRGSCTGVDDCVRAVRQEVHRGAGVIKLRLAAQTYLDPKSGPMETAAEMQAIISTAHRLNRRVAVHSVGNSEANQMVIDAGADTIEHGPVSDQNIAAMAKRGTGFTCTLLAAKTGAEALGALADYYAKVKIACGRAYRAGVPILFGSDIPVEPADQVPEEFLLMQEAGLTPADALKSATTNAAAALGMGDTLGSIAPGKAADIIAVPGDPRADLHVMGKVAFVMKGGKVFKPQAR